MSYPNEDIHIKLQIQLAPEERAIAKSYAKSQGMTLQGWLGQLVKRELASAGLLPGLHNLPPFSNPFGVPVVPCPVGSSPNVDGIKIQGVDSRCSDKDRDGRFSSDPIPCAAGCVTPCNPSKDGPAAPSLSDKEEG